MGRYDIEMQDISGIKREPYYDYSPHSYVTVIPVEYSCSSETSNISGHLRQTDESRLSECDTPHRPPASYRSLHPEHIPHQSSLNRSFHSCYPSGSNTSEWNEGNNRTQNKKQVCVFLMNKVGLCLDVDRIQLVTAQNLLDTILDDDQEVGLPLKAREIFSLWITSPLLELQLKSYQKPFCIRQQWTELLTKYTTASRQKIEMDEPILSFQRNVFFDKREEIRIDDMKIMELLYEEAKANILDGRYPCEIEDCEVLAGIQARLELGSYDIHIHTPNYFRTRLQDYLPAHACKRGWSFFGFGSKTGPEQRIIEKYKNISSNTTTYKLLRKYLEFCWALPYYGSAFFQGQVEKSVKGISAFINHYDMPILIAINREGIHLIKHSEAVVLLSLHYQQFSWDYANPLQSNNPDCLPCLFIQFHMPGTRRQESKLLQIFSRQAFLMDKLISAFVEELKKQNLWGDQVDHLSASEQPDDDVFPISPAKLCSELSLTRNLKRLSLATFNETGIYFQ